MNRVCRRVWTPLTPGDDALRASIPSFGLLPDDDPADIAAGRARAAQLSMCDEDRSTWAQAESDYGDAHEDT